MTKGCKKRQYRAFWRLAIALALVTAFCLINMSPALALELNPWDYFQISYDPVVLDNSDIQGNETFHAIVSGRAVCYKDLPVSASQAIMTSRVVARHTVSGTMVTLNTKYIVTIEPFPNNKGDTIEISQSIPLQFPPDALSGDYEVIGQLIEAIVKVKVMFADVTIPVTSFLPQEERMDTVKYTAPEPAPAPASTPNPPDEPSRTTPPEPAPAPTPTPAPSPSFDLPEPEQIIPWWIQIIVLIAVAATAFNVVWYLRHRRR